jgi:hypothetical protein
VALAQAFDLCLYELLIIGIACCAGPPVVLKMPLLARCAFVLQVLGALAGEERVI